MSASVPEAARVADTHWRYASQRLNNAGTQTSDRAKHANAHRRGHGRAMPRYPPVAVRPLTERAWTGALRERGGDAIRIRPLMATCES